MVTKQSVVLESFGRHRDAEGEGNREAPAGDAEVVSAAAQRSHDVNCPPYEQAPLK